MTTFANLPMGRAPKGKEVVELRRVTKDRFGDETPSDTLVTFSRCVALPRVLDEDNDRGSLVIPGFTIYIPPMKYEWDATVAGDDQEVRATDQLKVRGRWLEVEGEVATYVDLKGKLKGTMAVTKGEAL